MLLARSVATPRWLGKPPREPAPKGTAFLCLLQGLLGAGADSGAGKGAGGTLESPLLLPLCNKISGQVAE